MQIHCIVSEVLKAATGTTYLSQLSEFENQKMPQLIEFYKGNRGREPTIQTLSKRILAYMQNYMELKHGLGSFVLGRDYKPGMDLIDNSRRDRHKPPDPTGYREIQMLIIQ